MGAAGPAGAMLFQGLDLVRLQFVWDLSRNSLDLAMIWVVPLMEDNNPVLAFYGG